MAHVVAGYDENGSGSDSREVSCLHGRFGDDIHLVVGHQSLKKVLFRSRWWKHPLEESTFVQNRTTGGNLENAGGSGLGDGIRDRDYRFLGQDEGEKREVLALVEVAHLRRSPLRLWFRPHRPWVSFER